MSLLPHLSRAKGHYPSPCFTRHRDLEEHGALQPCSCPGHSWNFACSSGTGSHTECFLQCRHCTELQGARTQLKSPPSSANRELLAFRNFTHPSLLCLVFPFCSHYLFIRITQTLSQTHWNPVLGSISSSSPPPQAAPEQQQHLRAAGQAPASPGTGVTPERERREGENTARF